VAGIALFVVLSGSAYAVSTQIPRQSVGTIQLRDNAVTSPKIRDSTITTSDVRNRSLLANDFARGQLPAGPVSVATTLQDTDTHEISATCPSGKKVLGGGGRVIGGGVDENTIVIVRSAPSGDTQWTVRGLENDNAGVAWGVEAYAICATVS
jgi:hypothetical protein